MPVLFQISKSIPSKVLLIWEQNNSSTGKKPLLTESFLHCKRPYNILTHPPSKTFHCNIMNHHTASALEPSLMSPILKNPVKKLIKAFIWKSMWAQSSTFPPSPNENQSFGTCLSADLSCASGAQAERWAASRQTPKYSPNNTTKKSRNCLTVHNSTVFSMSSIMNLLLINSTFQIL